MTPLTTSGIDGSSASISPRSQATASQEAAVSKSASEFWSQARCSRVSQAAALSPGGVARDSPRPRGDGAAHEVARRGAVLEQVRLVPAVRFWRRGRDVLDADRRVLAEAEERAGAAAGARRGALARAVDERVHARGRREDG
jgi:hypothetical protein